MTQRQNPNNPTGQGAPEPVENDGAVIMTALDAALVAHLALVDTGADDVEPFSTSAVVFPLVRDWSERRRSSAIMMLVDQGAGLDAITSVRTAPTGPTPVENLGDAIRTALDAVAALVLAGRARHDSTTLDDDALVSTFAAALTRAEPAPDVDVERAERGRRSTNGAGRRPRRTIARDYNRSGAAGNYDTPGSTTTGATSGVIRLRVAAGVPSFTTSDGSTFTNATSALRHQDGWVAGLTGWGNPFDVLHRSNGPSAGSTLGALTALVTS